MEKTSTMEPGDREEDPFFHCQYQFNPNAIHSVSFLQSIQSYLSEENDASGPYMHFQKRAWPKE